MPDSQFDANANKVTNLIKAGRLQAQSLEEIEAGDNPVPLRIIGFVRKHPACKQEDILNGITEKGQPLSGVKAVLKKLLKKGEVVRALYEGEYYYYTKEKYMELIPTGGQRTN